MLGIGTAIACLVAALLPRHDMTQTSLLCAATGLVIAAGVITKRLNMPINAVVMTWSAKAPPGEWERLRDAWWHWHLLRLTVGGIGFGLLAVAALRQRG